MIKFLHIGLKNSLHCLHYFIHIAAILSFLTSAAAPAIVVNASTNPISHFSSGNHDLIQLSKSPSEKANTVSVRTDILQNDIPNSFETSQSPTFYLSGTYPNTVTVIRENDRGVWE
jgi:hypothetical protein